MPIPALLVLGAATTAPANPVLWGLALYGVARAIYDAVGTTEHKEKAAAAAKAVVETLVATPQAPQAPFESIANVALDIDHLQERWDKGQELGLYAYLCENNLVKDWHHGKYIIEKELLPLLAKAQMEHSRLQQQQQALQDGFPGDVAPEEDL